VSFSNQSAGVDEIEEDGLEPVVPVDEREIEPSALCQQARENALRLLGVELDEVADARFFEELQADVGICRRMRRE
jgi:hypothetical protein